MPEDEKLGAKAPEVVTPTPPAPVAEPNYKEIAEQSIAIAEATAEKLAKAESDRDNYKTGMLVKEDKLKSLKEQGIDIGEVGQPITAADVERMVEEKVAQRLQTPVPEVATLTKTISELKTALVNRQGLPATPTGNSQDPTPEPKATRWVDEPETAKKLKEQGLDPDKVFENWKANKPE